MNELGLQSNEGILLQESGVRMGGTSSYNGELYLTNLNIIYIVKGMFGKVKDLQKFPLQQIKKINGQLQALSAKSANSSEICLQLFFVNRTVIFEFQNNGRKASNNFVDEINNAVNGTPATSAKASFAIPGTEELAGTIKDTFGIFKNALGIKEKTENITVRCLGCHAPLAGIKGEKIQCSYCDTEQTLQSEE